MAATDHTAQHLGSGLFLGDARDEPMAPRASREGPRRYRPEIQGIRDGAIVRSWSSPDIYADRAEALAVAVAQFALTDPA